MVPKKNHYTVVNKDYWSAFYKKTNNFSLSTLNLAFDSLLLAVFLSNNCEVYKQMYFFQCIFKNNFHI